MEDYEDYFWHPRYQHVLDTFELMMEMNKVVGSVSKSNVLVKKFSKKCKEILYLCSENVISCKQYILDWIEREIDCKRMMRYGVYRSMMRDDRFYHLSGLNDDEIIEIMQALDLHIEKMGDICKVDIVVEKIEGSIVFEDFSKNLKNHFYWIIVTENSLQQKWVIFGNLYCSKI